MACLGITGAMRTAPTAATEVFLGLSPLHLQVAEARIGNLDYVATNNGNPNLMILGTSQMGSDKMTPRHVYNEPYTIRLPDRSEWNKGFRPNKKGGLMRYTDRIRNLEMDENHERVKTNRLEKEKEPLTYIGNAALTSQGMTGVKVTRPHCKSTSSRRNNK
jgi:hypothetical protein